ncbi:MAG TPA: phosphatase PAP2 family protein [Nevskia sp.]|nr:phosphatase PAP2 family protein [Nevskia sp.]
MKPVTGVADDPAAPVSRHWAGWLPVLAVALLDTLLLAGSDFSVKWRAELPALAGAVLLASLWGVYGRLRRAPRLAELAYLGLVFLLFTNAAAIFSYLLTGLSGLPLHDGRLAAVDRALGFDWPGLYHWLRAAHWRWLLACCAYFSLGPQLILLLLLLSPLGHADRARELYLGFVISSLAVIVLGALLPAAGAFVEYRTPEAQHRLYVLQYLALRDGSLRAIDLGQVQGLVQFPSFHAALAVLCCHAVRGLRGLFPLSLVLNLLVIAATPSVGGHHLTDVLAGLLLAGATIALVARSEWPRGAAAPLRQLQAANASAPAACIPGTPDRR